VTGSFGSGRSGQLSKGSQTIGAAGFGARIASALAALPGVLAVTLGGSRPAASTAPTATGTSPSTTGTPMRDMEYSPHALSTSSAIIVRPSPLFWQEIRSPNTCQA